MLPGVTRGAVAALAREAGYRIREGSFTLPALLRAEEAFTSSAVREIMPVVAVDGREMPRGEARSAGCRHCSRSVPPTDVPWTSHGEKIRLGGMALSNGVLVHGPTSWACAVRTEEGEIKVVAGRKRLVGSRIQSPCSAAPHGSRGGRVAAAPQAGASRGVAPVRARRARRGDARHGGRSSSVRRSRLGDSAKEFVAGLLASRRRWCRCGRARSPPTTAPSTSRSARYEHGEPRAKEHERCGSHLVGPMLATAIAGNMLAARAPVRAAPRRTARGDRRRAPASTEIFGWMQRNPEHLLARALAQTGSRAPAPPRDRRADAGAARGRRGRSAACLELEDA